MPDNSGDRNFDVTAASSHTIVAFEAQEGQTEVLNTPLQDIHSHQNTDDETANLSANNSMYRKRMTLKYHKITHSNIRCQTH